VGESAVGVLFPPARGLDDPVETHEVTQDDAHRSCPFGCSALNTLQFSFVDLAPTLPNRGVAMVYLALEDN